jgi:hypothetical protein
MKNQQAIATSAAIPSAGLMMASERRRYVTIAECAAVRPFTAPALRDLRFKAFDRTNSRKETIKGNGTGPIGVWVQIGAKVLIDLDAFDAWLESHRVKGGQ